MVVRNDESVIEECLNSVKSIADCICICNAGSTDNTLQIIEKFTKKANIPVIFQEEESKNFGYPHTLSVEAAKKTLEVFNFPLAKSYLLILDPDMKLHTDDDFKKEQLEADAYSLLEKTSSLSFSNYAIHLLKASIDWKNVGASHALWDNKESLRSVKLKSLSIEDLGDSGYKTRKLERDIELLNESLKIEPHNARYLFFLAQTHKSLKHYQEAIRGYQAHIEKGGSKEEIWLSKYMIGETYEEMGQWEHALYWYLEAFQYYPERAESLKKVTTHYRLKGKNDLAYIFAKYGSNLPLPSDQNLFPSSPLCDYQFDEELSIAAYYTRFREEGFVAANDVVFHKNLPWQVREQTYRNMLYYVPNLKDAHFVPISIELPFIQEGTTERFHPMNPCITKTDQGYEVICRAVNYTQKGAKEFHTNDENGIFRNKNFLLNYSKELKILSQKELVENLYRERIRSCSLEGIEDCRLFQYNKALWFTCTTCDTNPTGQRQISLCKLSDDKTSEIVPVEKLVPLKGPDLSRCEKNWLPFVKDGSIHLIYSFDPFLILRPNLETGHCTPVLEYQPTHDFTRFRGSAAPIEFDHGYLVLVHEVVLHTNYERCYLHRFLYLDKNFVIKEASLPFTFLHQGVEFCCSMTYDHSGKHLILPIGIEDREAYLCTVSVDTVRDLLKPLPKY